MSQSSWVPFPVSKKFKDSFLTEGEGETEIFSNGALMAVRSKRPFTGYQLSISHPMRLPTWQEVKDARYAMLPNNIVVAMILPPINEYVNIHENCLQMFEISREEYERVVGWK